VPLLTEKKNAMLSQLGHYNNAIHSPKKSFITGSKCLITVGFTTRGHHDLKVD
jgi:hypothetical protein